MLAQSTGRRHHGSTDSPRQLTRDGTCFSCHQAGPRWEGSHMQVSTWSSTVDWICLGSGAGGCAAALAGQMQGFTVLLVERSPFICGTTSPSGGVFWGPMKYLPQEAGLHDSRPAPPAYPPPS